MKAIAEDTELHTDMKGCDTMENLSKSNTLAIYLLALAKLQATGKTHVNYEILDVIELIKKEFDLD